MSDWSERSGAAHLNLDILDVGHRLARGVFEGDSPAGRLGGPAQRTLLLAAVDFNHYTVNFVRKLLPFLLPFPAKLEDLVECVTPPPAIIDFEPMRC